MKPETLHELWMGFASKVMDKECPPIQWYEMEGAFKSGAIAVLLEMQSQSFDIPEDAAVQKLEEWVAEYKAFIEARVHSEEQGKTRVN